MPGFVAEHAVQPLDWNFAPYFKASGTIREPSDEAIGNLLSAMKALGQKIKADAGVPDLDTDDPMAILMALENLDPQVFVTIMADLAAAFAEMCSNKPSKAQILSLPLRVRMGFYNWLMGEVTSPEASTGAGNGAAQTPPVAAAGSSSTSSASTSESAPMSGTG